MDKYMRYLCRHESNTDFLSNNRILNRSEMRTMALDMIKNTRNYHTNSGLTIADNIAWWEYIKFCLPRNYERAILHKKIGEDVNIGDLDGVEKLQINDYFELYGLPRVVAENGIVSVNGEKRIRYANRMSYFKNRDVFTLAHSDRRFYAWKREQLNHCQKGRCAWCGRPVKMNESEIDHVLPLIFFGKNEPWNMVVACKECNGNKSSDTKGWNETGNRLIGNKKPKWIQKNKCDFLMRKALVDAEKKYNEGESSGSMVLAKQQAVAS